MAEVSPGIGTSEFKLATIIGALTTFGDKVDLFNVSSFDNEQLLIYRGIQILVLGGIAIAYIWGRSKVKTNGNS